jgi:hypothetical protein
MTKSIVIYSFPITLYESRNQQQERALRLMEISDQDIDNPEMESRDYDDARSDLQ